MITIIQEEIKKAMKARNSNRLVVLRMIMSDAKNLAIAAKRKDVTEDDIITAVSKGIKQCNDSSEHFTKAGRTDLIDIGKQQLDVYTEFAPKQLSDDELRAAVHVMCVGATIKDMGKVMGLLMKTLPKGSVDGKVISSMVRTRLNDATIC